MFFFLNVVIVWVDGKFWASLMTVWIVKLELFWSIRVFEAKVLRLGGCFSGLLRLRLNLRMVVVFLDILFLILMHSMLHLIISIFVVACVVLVTIILFHVLSMHVILHLIHPFL